MRKLNKIFALIAIWSLGVAMPAVAQEPALQEDPLFGTLFPPELIMQHRRAIDLTDHRLSTMVLYRRNRVTHSALQML